MKNILSLSIVIINFALVTAQTITNQEIWSGTFYPASINGIESQQDGEHYTVLTPNGIDQYSYKTFQKTNTIIQGKFSDYQFNSNESWLLLETNPIPIYRHSKKATYTLYKPTTKKKYPLFNGKPIQEPTLSPDGTKVAFMAEDNNLYYQEIETSNVKQITTDGKKNHIINGITDWVYEEEFGFVRAFDWNGNSNKIAFIRFDESKVPQMGIDIYGNQLYQTNLTFKYPKAGEKNANVSLHIYNLTQTNTKEIDLSAYNDFYIPKIEFNQATPKNADDLFVFIANRHQNQVDVWKINAQNNSKEKLFTETDKAYIETDHLDFFLINENQILWSSERDGNRHVYEYDYNGKLKQQLTQGNWSVTKIYGHDANNNTLYYQSNQTGSTNKGIYKLDLKTKKTTLLSPEKGVNNAQFSKQYQYFINTHSTGNTPPVYTLRDGNNGKALSVLEDNAQITKLQKEKQVSPKEYITININNNDLNAWMIKPPNFSPAKQYPLFMYQYSGPGSQEALNEWDTFNYWWFQSLAQQGYIVACVDGRGTGGKGTAFKKSTYQELGKYEIEDQIAAAKYFGKQSYINQQRIGMFGWSFGGYMTLLALTKGADVFKTGIAVAPVTNWRYYDTVYTERFMRTPQENPNGYDQNSPINFAQNLTGKLLLVHGSADDNVHVQNTMQMAEALIQANKDFDLMIYPDKNHGIYGGNTRLHLYNKMTKFILEKL